MPVPLRAEEAVPPGLADTLRLVCLLPPLLGSKRTETVHVRLAASVAPFAHVPPPTIVNWVVSPPLIVGVNGPLVTVPVLVTVNVFVELPEFTTTSP